MCVVEQVETRTEQTQAKAEEDVEKEEEEVVSVDCDALGLYGAVDALHMKVVMVIVKLTC